MKLHLELERLNRSASGAITAPIYLRIGDDFFPENGWNDFPVMILATWQEEVAQFLGNVDTVVLPFFDGSYHVMLRRLLGGPRVDGYVDYGLPDSSISAESLNIGMLWSEIRDATAQLLEQCRERGWSSEYITALERIQARHANLGEF